MRALAVLFICVLSQCKCDDSNFDDFAKIDSIFQEPECSSQGGMCVIAGDCAGQLTRQTGLCPKQASQGVECCNGLSRKETRCSKLGMCVPMDTYCNQRLVFSRATDCGDQKCCILVK